MEIKTEFDIGKSIYLLTYSFNDFCIRDVFKPEKFKLTHNIRLFVEYDFIESITIKTDSIFYSLKYNPGMLLDKHLYPTKHLALQDFNKFNKIIENERILFLNKVKQNSLNFDDYNENLYNELFT